MFKAIAAAANIQTSRFARVKRKNFISDTMMRRSMTEGFHISLIHIYIYTYMLHAPYREQRRSAKRTTSRETKQARFCSRVLTVDLYRTAFIFLFDTIHAFCPHSHNDRSLSNSHTLRSRDRTWMILHLPRKGCIRIRDDVYNELFEMVSDCSR